MSNSFFGGFQFISLWIQEPLVDSSLSATSVGIKVLKYPGLMANRWDDDHHNNDGGNNVDNTVLSRAKFLKFREEAHDENQQFH